MVKCLTHGLRGFNGAVQRRLATLTVTMLISSCWQLSSEVELRRIFDVCKRWANSGSHEFVKKNMIRYMRPHWRFAHCSYKNAVRQPPVLASRIEIYYFPIHNGILVNVVRFWIDFAFWFQIQVRGPGMTIVFLVRCQRTGRSPLYSPNFTFLCHFLKFKNQMKKPYNFKSELLIKEFRKSLTFWLSVPRCSSSKFINIYYYCYYYKFICYCY